MSNRKPRKDIIDLTGKVFGTIRVLGLDVEKSNAKKKIWFCECTETGIKRKFVMSELTSGRATSIGRGSHGHSKDQVYGVWEAMKGRCNNPKDKAYKNYGGRGIKVSKSWNNFENFMKDMGPRPDGLTLDREDNDGDYCKENCRWVTSKVQNNNHRRNVVLTVLGKEMTMMQFCEKYKLRYNSVQRHITDMGRSVLWVLNFYGVNP